MKKGSVLAETVLAMPLLLLLAFAVVQFSLIWVARQHAVYAAYCAARAKMVVPGPEKREAAESAAMTALSWMCIAEREGSQGGRVDIPGWGAIPGSASVRDRVTVDKPGDIPVFADGESSAACAASVRFRFPLMIPAMGVNKVIANAFSSPAEIDGDSFYEDLEIAAGDPPKDIDGFWPYIELKERCVLPAPYSTANFPAGAMRGTSLTGGR